MKATTEGVVLIPSAFSITLGAEPSIMATQELVVPRSIPITCLVVALLKRIREKRVERLPIGEAFKSLSGGSLGKALREDGAKHMKL